MKRLAIVLAIGLIATSASAAPDEKLKAAAEQAKPALIETLKQMVLIESGSSDVDGVRKMADFAEARLKALGAKTERRKVMRGPGGDILIATFEGSGTKKLMPLAALASV